MTDMDTRVETPPDLLHRMERPVAARPLRGVRLLLCMTRGASLAVWARGGMLRRELHQYESLANAGAQVTLLTYGDRSDAAHLAPGSPIALLTNRWRLPATLYSLLAPWLHRLALRGTTIIKTHQFNGAWTGAIAKRLLRARLVVRGGYVWSVLCREQPAWKRRVMAALEGIACRAADRIIVATESDRTHLLATHRLDPDRIVVLPNAVDVETFKPTPELAREPGRVIVVGRLETQKQPHLLLDAVRDLSGVRLVMVGDGALRASLAQRIRDERLPVELLGAVPHERLPALLNRSELFVLPSRIEGHPKALLEAMACGLAVIGCDVPGIREVIDHGRTGWLCAPTAAGLRAAIDTLLADAPLRRRLGDAARDRVQSDCAIESIIEREVEMWHAL